MKSLKIKLLLATTFLPINIIYADHHNTTSKNQGIAYITGNNISGTVKFIEEKKGEIKVDINLKGVTTGEHGFHIHEFGDCSVPDFSSAGGHFNPIANDHGSRESKVRHHGDLGNISVSNKDKTYKASFSDSKLSLTGDNSIIGRSIIIHQNKDDFTTQPTGNAGGRIACGVIGITK
jgi:superoxide dismutase, Cu-Zn family